MIAWKKFVITSETESHVTFLGDGSTSNWLGVELNATGMTGATFQLNLPTVDHAMGRVITVTANNPSLKTLVIAPASGEQIRDNGTDVNSRTTSNDLVTMTLICDGVRWVSLYNDGSWV